MAAVSGATVPMAGAIKVNKLMFNGALCAPRLTVGLQEVVDDVGVRLLHMHAAAVLEAESVVEEEDAWKCEQEDMSAASHDGRGESDHGGSSAGAPWVGMRA